MYRQKKLKRSSQKKRLLLQFTKIKSLWKRSKLKFRKKLRLKKKSPSQSKKHRLQFQSLLQLKSKKLASHR